MDAYLCIVSVYPPAMKRTMFAAIYGCISMYGCINAPIYFHTYIQYAYTDDTPGITISL